MGYERGGSRSRSESRYVVLLWGNNEADKLFSLLVGVIWQNGYRVVV